MASTGWCCWRRMRQGYGNLCHLVSSAHLDRPVELDPHVPFAALEKANEGLIALTAGSEGALGAAACPMARRIKAEIYLDRLQALFPDRLYIEIIRRNDPVEEASEDALDRAGLRAQSAARRDQSGGLFGSELPRRARRHAVHRAIRLHREQRSADLLAGGVAEGLGGDGRAVRRLARSARQHRRHRPALRGGRTEAQADPSAPVGSGG